MSEYHQIGKFVLLRELPETPLGRNFRAAELGATGLTRIVQLTRLIDEVTSEDKFQESLQKKFSGMSSFTHENINLPHEVNNMGGVLISQEYVEGFNIKSILKRCTKSNLPFSIDYALFAAARLCNALEHAHAQKIDGKPLLHAGITPYNVHITAEGEIMISDWAINATAGKMTTAQNIFLQRYQVYLSPEQAEGKPATVASDIFQVGLLLYEMLAGKPLYSTNRPEDAEEKAEELSGLTRSADSKTIPDEVAGIVAKALKTNPKERYKSIKEFREELDALLYSGEYLATTTKTSFLMSSIFKEELKMLSENLKAEQSADYSEYISKLASATSEEGEEITAEEVTSGMLPGVGEIEVEEETDIDLGSEIIGYTATKKFPVLPVLGGIIAAVIIIVILIVVGGGKEEQPEAMGTVETPEMLALRQKQAETDRQLQELLQKAAKSEEERKQKEAEIAIIQAEKDQIAADRKKLQEQQDARSAAAQKREKARLDKEKADKEKRDQELAKRQKQIEMAKRLESSPPKTTPTSTSTTPAASTTSGPTTTPTTEGTEESAEDKISILNSSAVKLELEKQVRPTYPKHLKRAGIRRKTIVRILIIIGVDGKVEQATVLTGDPQFRSEALKAARQWEYKPVTQNGKPVKVSKVIDIGF